MTEIKAATNCDIIRYIFVDLHCCQNFLLKTDRKLITFAGTDVLLVILQYSCNSTGTFS